MNREATRESLCNRAPMSRWAMIFVRIALAAAFLSAVADRFGFWGVPGAGGVAWGNIENYEAYVGVLLWYVPMMFIPILGWIATVAEISIAVGLLVGWQLRWFALAAGLLLTVFALSMFAALGPKPPLDFSVFSAASAAFLLFTVSQHDRSLAHPCPDDTCT